MGLDGFDRFKRAFFLNAKIFKKTFLNVEEEFGLDWKREFSAHVEKVFGESEVAYENAAKGYAKFSLDAMRLQKLFNKNLKYEDMSYQDACDKVYHNQDYMMDVYLPGTFVSHFLWRHHYKHFLYYKNNFLPLLKHQGDKRFYDVGTGTGFYTLQIFRYDQNFRGVGVEISPHSRRFTLKNVGGWGYDQALELRDVNIIENEFEPFPCVQSIEVLEHLADPQLFLRHLRKLLMPGGYGFITAALTAPNPDHIYLYWTPDEVIQQLSTAGFKVQDYIEEEGYVGQPGEYVPKVAAFIVS